MRQTAILALVLGASCAAAEPDPPAQAPIETARAAGLEEVAAFGSNPGHLRMFRHVPRGVGPGAPLVVALHGCTQTAVDAARSGWNDVADARGFVVVYPEQRPENNLARCFAWSPALGDDAGESLSVAQMVDRTVRDLGVDETRLFVTGFSAGGAAAARLLASSPGRFAAGAVLAAIPVGCAGSLLDVGLCMQPGADLSPESWAARARVLAPGYDGPYPRLSIWTGAWDTVVAPRNQGELLEQLTALHGIDRDVDAEDTAWGRLHRVYEDGGGVPVVETWTIGVLDHAVPVSPWQGCGRSGPYRLDVGLCAAAEIADFFSI